jgi:hypothetical protein
MGRVFSRPIVGRGLASADIDLDSDADLLFTTNGGAPLLLRNDGGNKNNAMRLVLRGRTANHSAVGALVKVKLANSQLRRRVHSGSSYLSQSELPLTLGLGNATVVEQLLIQWPSKRTTKLSNLPTNSALGWKHSLLSAHFHEPLQTPGTEWPPILL